MKQESCCAVLSETNLRTDHAANYANQLLDDLGQAARVESLADHPALAWRRSGLLGATDAMLPIPLASAADGALLALRAISSDPAKLPEIGSQLVGERARLRETTRIGRENAGGYGRLMDLADGRLALNLVRDDDWDLIPAWLEDYVTDWDGIEAALKHRAIDDMLARAAELGLAVAHDRLPDKPDGWFKKTDFAKKPMSKTPLIVDLSSLWAGPLCSSLLAKDGAEVVKVESPHRPDGMRFGHKGFYTLINGGKSCAAFNFKDGAELEKLKTLIDKADIVIEASRPRALPQIGICAEDFTARKPGKIWLRLTAYDRQENRIGFGDDIGISSGLATIMEHAHGQPCFVGDAIADSVSGLHMALAIKAEMKKGGGAILDFSMCDVVRYAMGDIPESLQEIAQDWSALADRDSEPYYEMRRETGIAKPLGADTQDILHRLCS